MKNQKQIPKDVAIEVAYNYLVIDGKTLFQKLGNKAPEFTKGLNLYSLDSLIYVIDMGHSLIAQIHDRLVDHGLNINEDYIIDTVYSWYGVDKHQYKRPKLIVLDFSVDWLQGVTSKKGTFLWRTNRSIVKLSIIKIS